MSRGANARKIIHELKSRRAPEPPAALRESLLREVPAVLELSPEVSGEVRTPPRRPARWMLAAASVALAAAAGVVAVRVRHDVAPRVMVNSPREAPAQAAVTDPRALDRTADEAAAERRSGAAPVARPAAPVPAPAPSATEPDGAVRFRVADTGGEPLPGVRVEVTGPGAPRTAITDARGEAEIDQLVPGRYQVAAELEGFSSIEYPDVPVRRAKDTSLEVSLAPAVEEAITVTSESPMLDERKISAGTVVTDMAAIGSSPTVYDFKSNEQVVPPPVRKVPVPVAPPPPPSPPPPAERALKALGYVGEAGAVPAPSTGGTAEPNDQPYGDVFFRAYGTNPFVDTEDDPLSTFALDVDTGSYGVVRRYLTDGHLPPPEAVRVEEMINAFDYGDPPPAPREGDFALYAQGARTPFAAGDRYRLVRFALAARQVSAAERKSAVLTFVVDVSGSMAQENRLGLVRKALGLLVDQLRQDDRVALVVYGSRGRVVLPHTGDLGAIRSAIDRLVPEGATNAEEGLTLGYDLARSAFREGSINRVILCSDGVANVGATGPDSILARIGAEARGGIELTTVGFGMGNYNDVLIEQLADRGDGAYAYVDTLDEARRVFVENLTGTLQTVARDAKVQVEFDPEVVARYRLLGYENRDVPDERFRDDTVDAGEVGAGHTVTALYEVKLRPHAPRRATAATLRLRYASAETGEVVETAETIAVRDLEQGWETAPRGLRLASVVAELGELLKHSYWAKEGDLDGLFRRAQAVSAAYPGDLRVAELATLVGKAAALARGASHSP